MLHVSWKGANDYMEQHSNVLDMGFSVSSLHHFFYSLLTYSTETNRFSEVANLKLVWWLEINGKMNTCILSPRTNYVVYLVFQRNDRFHGFEGNPIEASVGIVGGETTTWIRNMIPTPTRLDQMGGTKLNQVNSTMKEEMARNSR